MVQWLSSANIRWPAVLIALSTLVACGTTPGERRAAPSGSGWRVVERVGEARYSPPGAASWLPATTGQSIVGGSEIQTGRGGRLIVATPGRHISVGSASRFVLPRPGRDDRLEQRAGWLRYRMADPGAEPFRVHTRSLDLEFAAAVLDVRVDRGGTAVTVSEGEVRLATPDGLRHAQLAPGQSAEASGPGGTQLALRRFPKDAPEPVGPVIVPAIHPAPTAAVDPATARPSAARGAGPGAAIAPPSVDDPEPGPERAPGRARTIDHAPAPEADRAAGSVSSDEGLEASAKRLAAIDQTEAAAVRAVAAIRSPIGRDGKFERLTAGVLDGVRPSHPALLQP